MNLVIFILVIAISFIIVRIGAVAFQLTGLDWDVAKFQALSCFSSTGFTTKESELITANKQRRTIATFLIILGNAGLVTLIATLANTLKAPQILEEKLSRRLLPFEMPQALAQLINLTILIIALYIIIKIFTNITILKKITDTIRNKFITKNIIKPQPFSEIAQLIPDVGLFEVEVSSQTRLAGKTLKEAKLENEHFVSFAIIRDDRLFKKVPETFVLDKNDRLLCIGNSEKIRRRFSLP